jgi:hypothetical protein
MFLNRKLIVQLSTSRFRPQPKETNNSVSQPPKQLMIMATSSPSIAYHHLSNGGGSTITQQQQQQPNTLTQQYPNGMRIEIVKITNVDEGIAIVSEYHSIFIS